MSVVLRVDGRDAAFGGVQALDACSLEVEKGTITGLIGPNGSGKTTLFNVMTGYVAPDTGRVEFQGRDITRARPDADLRAGRRPDLPADADLREHLGAGEHAGRHAARRELAARPDALHVLQGRGRPRAMEWLDFVGIAKLARLPAGALSFGQRKLLELAYVLVADPDVILLDEPAGGVNLTLINEIAGRIRALNRAGKTFLIVEHNMEFVMDLCDSVTVMHQGSDLVSGTPAEIRHDARVLDAYLGGGEEDEEPLEVTRG